MPREEDLDAEDELRTDEDDLSEDELLTVVPPLLLLLSCEPRETFAEDLRLLSCELLDTLEPLLRLLSWELLDEDLVWEEVVVPLDPEESLSCEYESTGDAIRANATADAIAMFRMFFILIRC